MVLAHVVGIFEYAAEFAHDRVTGEAQFAQNFTDRAHNFRQMIGRDNDQRDDQKENYFKNTQT